MEILINDTIVVLQFLSYDNGRLAIPADEKETGEPYAVLTTNLVDEEVGEDEAFLDTNNIPDVVSPLKQAGLIEGEPIRYGISGHCMYPLFKIKKPV